MDDSEITALANGMAPFVRECVAEAFDKIVMPPELAEQVASAVRLLAQSPPMVPAPRGRVARIERDEHGNFIPIYDEPA